ncbi:MAG: imidazoleglycerol-phosphate dehydratase HisB [Chloroflexi bacterium]|nr:imidazoleglycerol-phosphate dehydratase HisB [Chloroflexota bacterium]
MTQRKAGIQRETKETSIQLELNVDGTGNVQIETGVGALDHLLTLFASHGLFDLSVRAKGDLAVDEHHLVEDVAIVLGQAFAQALSDRRGMRRMAHALVPMDEALAMVALDLGGRSYCVLECRFDGPRMGDLGTDLIRHFFDSFSREARLNLFAIMLHGQNDHHRAEALFKALGRALDGATQIDERIARQIPSTKGVIEN